MRRRGIGWAVMVFLGFTIILGLVWAVLYYGSVTSMFNNLPTQYPGAYDSNTLTFVEDFAELWTVILTMGGIYWLWLQSQKDYS